MRRKSISYDPVLAEKVCNAVANSNKPLRAICRELKKGLTPRIVYSWLTKHDAFRADYARAREFQMQILADQIIELADTPKIGTVTKIKANGKTETRTGDNVERSRLQIDSRKWLLSKLASHRYGDKPEAGADEKDPLGELLKSMERRYDEISDSNEAQSDAQIQ